MRKRALEKKEAIWRRRGASGGSGCPPPLFLEEPLLQEHLCAIVDAALGERFVVMAQHPQLGVGEDLAQLVLEPAGKDDALPAGGNRGMPQLALPAVNDGLEPRNGAAGLHAKDEYWLALPHFHADLQGLGGVQEAINSTTVVLCVRQFFKELELGGL